MSNKDPSDYIYVSNKHLDRKDKVINGGDDLAGLVGRPGPITGIVLSFIDIILTLFLKLSFNLFKISSFAFGWVNNITFGNFAGVIPSSLKQGKVISMKFFRYCITVLMPPFGIFLAKGLYGWFSILVCIVITYINFIAGIVYAFVITANNRYADQYEAQRIKMSLGESPQEQIDADIYAFASSLFFIVLNGVFIYFCIGYF